MANEVSAGERSEEDAQVNSYRWVMPVASGGALLVAALLVIAAIYKVAEGADIPSVIGLLGYPGVSLIMFFSSATVLLPAPGLLSVLAASGVFQLNPWLLGLSAGLGSSLGELTGYVVGLGGRQVLNPTANRWVQRGEFFMRRWGFLTILGMATIPNPFFDAVGILAGGLGYPARRLWVACLIGNTIKSTAVAVFGDALAHFFGSTFPSLLPFLLQN